MILICPFEIADGNFSPLCASQPRGFWNNVAASNEVEEHMRCPERSNEEVREVVEGGRNFAELEISMGQKSCVLRNTGDKNIIHRGFRNNVAESNEVEEHRGENFQ